MTQTASLIAGTLVRPNIAPGSPIDLVSRPTDFWNLLVSQGLVMPSAGSSPFQWNVTSAGNGSAEIFVENQALPAAGRRTLARPSLAATYFRSVAAVTGHVMDQVRRGGTFEDVLQGEIGDGVKALYNLLETTLLGGTADRGIASIIDAGDTYAGVAPGTVAAWASSETAVGGALTAAVMHDAYETVTAAPFNAMPSVILMPPNQMTNYGNVAGTGATTPQTRFLMPATVSHDIGMQSVGMSYNGIPIVSIRQQTATEIYLLELGGLEFVVHRDLEVLPLARTNDNTQVQISVAGALKVHNRRRHAKLTGVTA